MARVEAIMIKRERWNNVERISLAEDGCLPEPEEDVKDLDSWKPWTRLRGTGAKHVVTGHAGEDAVVALARP